MTSLQSIEIDGSSFPIEVRRNQRAKRIIMRICPRDRVIRVTMPPRMPLDRAEDFISSHTGWILGKLRTMEPREFPNTLQIMGDPFQVKIDPLRRKPYLCMENQSVFLPKGSSLQEIKVALGGYAKDVLSSVCLDYAEQLGKSICSFSFRDPKSRWGSCSSDGRIMLSWRLVLAPPEVARYVCIHEVCHLEHMNHSNAFWGLVRRFDPHYHEHRAWLRTRGTDLYKVL